MESCFVCLLQVKPWNHLKISISVNKGGGHYDAFKPPCKYFYLKIDSKDLKREKNI